MNTWFDKPFFDLLNQMNSLLPYFLTQGKYIMYVLLTLNLLLSGIKYAITKQGLKESLIKAVEAYIIVMTLFAVYPKILTGINSIIYQWSINSTITKELSQNIQNVRNNYEFWQDKTSPENYAYSDIIKKVEEIDGSGNIGYTYVLDISMGDTGYLSPNCFMRLLMLIMEGIWKASEKQDKNLLGWPVNLMQAIFNIIACIAVLICGTLSLLQYVAGALEFQFIMAVGVITLPGMCMNGTKFLTEKFFGAVLGFFLKLLFVSIAMQLTVNGYLQMMSREFTGTLDQIIYMVVMSLWYLMICQNGPKLAVSLLTGTPQMSLMEGVQAAGTFAAAAIGMGHATKNTAGAVHQGGTHALGTAAKTYGAAKTGYQLNGGMGGAFKAAGASVLNSAGESVKSTVHGISNSLHHSPGKKTTYSGSGAGHNRFSQKEKYSSPNEKGESKTIKEYMSERMREGENKELNRLVKNESSAGKPASAAVHKAPQPTPAAAPLKGLPMGQQQYQLPESPTRLALPPPQIPPAGGK